MTALLLALLIFVGILAVVGAATALLLLIFGWWRP